MKALWHINSLKSEIRMEPLSATDSDTRVKSAYSLISVGTERLVAKGMINPAIEAHMRVPYMQGDFALPVKYGYSLTGITLDNKPVHVMHPHQDDIHVDTGALYTIPDDLSLKKGCLISNMETVINAIWDGELRKNDRIAICGFGGIGSLLATTLRVHYNLNVDIIEVDEWRQHKATELGWKLSNAGDYDIIYHTTATDQGLQYCIDHLNEEGRVIELSWYGDKKTTLFLGQDFHFKRLQIISSQVSTIPLKMSTQYDYKKRKDLAATYLQDGSYDDLITHLIPFDKAPEFFKKLRLGSQEKGLIYLIEY